MSYDQAVKQGQQDTALFRRKGGEHTVLNPFDRRQGGVQQGVARGSGAEEFHSTIAFAGDPNNESLALQPFDDSANGCLVEIYAFGQPRCVQPRLRSDRGQGDELDRGEFERCHLFSEDGSRHLLCAPDQMAGHLFEKVNGHLRSYRDQSARMAIDLSLFACAEKLVSIQSMCK